MRMPLILFSTVWDMDKFIRNGKKKYRHWNTCKPIIKDLPQIPGLRFWYPSIKFGHEINLKGLLHLVLLD